MFSRSVVHALPYRADDVFSVVADVESYPQFLPHCRALHILSQEKDAQDMLVLMARMSVGFMMLSAAFVSRVYIDRAARHVRVEGVAGPLRHLRNTWRCEDQGRETRVHFDLSYEFLPSAMSKMAAPLFNRFFSDYEAAFIKRVKQLYEPAA